MPKTTEGTEIGGIGKKSGSKMLFYGFGILILVGIAGGLAFQFMPSSGPADSGASTQSPSTDAAPNAGGSNPGGSGNVAPGVTETPGKDNPDGIVSSTPKPKTTGNLKLIKKYGPTKLPPYGEMQDGSLSYQILNYNQNGLKAQAKIISTRKVVDTRISLSTLEIKMPAGIVVKLLDDNSNYVFCKQDKNPAIGCYYYKFWLEGGESSDQIAINGQEITNKATQWEVLIYGS